MRPAPRIAVGRNTDGRLEVFAISAGDGARWHVWQDAGGTGGRSGWAAVGG